MTAERRAVTLLGVTCSRCKATERISGQRWCRNCLTDYARERRWRVRLEKQAPELLELARECHAQVEALLRSIGAMYQPPRCCMQTHMHMLVAAPCGCACHRARAWLESMKLPSPA